MKLQHIELDKLKTTRLNVRKKGATKVNDLVPSIRSLGIVQPLLVRKNCKGYDIIAGQRRFHALQKLAKEGELPPVPCLVMEEGDDAKAVEASLAENIARLPMDEIDQYKAFSALIKKGKQLEDIATHFGVSERLVKQRLAIANIMTPILNAYRKGDIHPSTLRILTMATNAQQKAWFALFSDKEDYAPEGYRLKEWLFGGANIASDCALFDLDDYQGNIIADLFGEEKYFDDVAEFWTHQNTAIAKAKEAYLKAGWSEVVILDVGEYFPSYDYVHTDKEDGGKIYVTVSSNGEVTFYEGLLHRKEIKARDSAKEGDAKQVKDKPELTKAMQNYLDVHRHSAVRCELLNHGSIALRLAVAQLIAGSTMWAIHADPQKTAHNAIKDSLSTNRSEAIFAKARQDVLALLGMNQTGEEPLVPRKDDWNASRDFHAIYAKLLELNDKAVNVILTFVVAESLPCTPEFVELLGEQLKLDMKDHWQADETFFNLLRDKQAINAILKEVAGKRVADANISSTAKVQKKIIQNCLDGKLKSSVKEWQPRYMAFPMKSYTKHGNIQAIDTWKALKKYY